jgi:MinD-like ATPase involved in chromosome partitioning or flagellar assembly
MSKRIVFTQGGKGGVGKTTVALSLYDYYNTKQAHVTLADFDAENRAKSGLNFWHKQAEKIDIHTRTGLDRLIDLALDSSSDIILADMGAGSGTVTYRWFADIYPELSNASVKLTSIGVVTADPGSVESILTWSAHLRTDVDYLIVLNELDQEGETFRYWHESKQAKSFADAFKPIVITMASRRADLEQAARNHGVSLAQIADRRAKAPELTSASIVMRAQSYRRQIDVAFESAAQILFP